MWLETYNLHKKPKEKGDALPKHRTFPYLLKLSSACFGANVQPIEAVPISIAVPGCAGHAAVALTLRPGCNDPCVNPWGSRGVSASGHPT